MINFLMDQESILDFCRCVEKADKDIRNIFMYISDKIFYLHVQSSYVTCVLSHPVACDEEFNLGIPFDIFYTSFKKLYDEVIFNVSENKLFLEKDNINIEIPICDYEPLSWVEPDKFLSTADKKFIVDSSSKCNYFTSVKSGYDGLLIDNNEFLRVCKINSSSIKIFTSISDSDYKYRFALGKETVGLLSLMKNNINTIAFNSNSVYLYMKGDIIVRLSLIYDSYPEEYLSVLGLKNEEFVVNTDIYNNYKFNCEDLLNAVETVSSVLGEDGLFVNLRCVGVSDDIPIWSVEGSSLNGRFAREIISCTEKGVVDNEAIIINKKDCLNIIKTYKGEVILHNLDEKPLVISNQERDDVSLLVKVSV